MTPEDPILAELALVFRSCGYFSVIVKDPSQSADGGVSA